MELKQRDSSIDIIKGIGIILMVCGHAEFPLRHFIYLFHMAVFYIASGYLFDTNKISDKKLLLRFAVRKLKTLYIPFVVYNSIFILLNNIFIKLNIYMSNATLADKYMCVDSIENIMTIKAKAMAILKCLFLIGGSQAGAALWFLRSLFMVTILYALIEYILLKFVKNNSYIMLSQTLISVLFLFSGYIIHELNIPYSTSIGNCLSVYILFFIGHSMKQMTFSKTVNKYKLPSILCSLAILMIGNQFGSIELNINFTSNPLFFLLVSVSGWVLLYSIAKSIQNYKYSKAIVFIGRNTMPILIFHFLAFKLINLIGILIYNMPIELTGTFPILFYGGFWWIAYTIAGITLPLLIKKGIKLLLNLITPYYAILCHTPFSH